MTDFGRRTGEMLKSVYDTDDNGVVDEAESTAAHAADHQNGGDDEISVAALSGELADDQPAKAHALGGAKHTAATLAELNAKVSDATLDDSSDSRTPAAHKASHQDGGTDEIDVTGLAGTTPRAILGQISPPTTLRAGRLSIANGTQAATLKCTLTNLWNGPDIATTDNIAKNATTGAFSLNQYGTILLIDAISLALFSYLALASLHRNNCNIDLTIAMIPVSGSIQISLRVNPGGAAQDITSLVDQGSITLNILYITYP